MNARALVARNLRRLRVQKHLSQEILAVDADIDRSYVSRLERSLENPTIAVLAKLARALDADLVEFFRQPSRHEPLPVPLRGGRKPRR